MQRLIDFAHGSPQVVHADLHVGRKSPPSRDAVGEGQGVVRTADFPILGGIMAHFRHMYKACIVY